MKINKQLNLFVNSIINSYSEIFFARNRFFGILLIGITFVDPFTGICGMFSVVATNLLAKVLGFSREAIYDGRYGFNSLLVGLGLGFYYSPNPAFFILLFVAALSTLLTTVAIAGVLQKYGLPYLSIPFLIGIWATLLASRNFEALELSERGIYTLNELYATGDNWLIILYKELKQLPIPELLKIYFNSLGAILFQFNPFSGILIAIGLLVYSRIAFSLSIVSFTAAYYFYQILGADIQSLSYSYIGFNFILSGIALGSYFLVPSRSSYLWAILLVPGLMILTSSFGSLFEILQLSIYALPFNIMVITFLYVLKLRHHPKEPEEVVIQQYIPEHNLYHRISSKNRFLHYKPVAISAPVFGKWYISQGHNSSLTHRGEWKEAWDFVITGDDGEQYKNEGKAVEEYHCYNKPIMAPADGTVEIIINEIDDNLIGDVNLEQNWGNSIVIRHEHQLYSQISHIRRDSFKVRKGNTIKKGDIIASCGNSGRSPYPHIHFQIQSTPFVGSKTMDYPLSHFITDHSGLINYHFFGYPKECENINNIETQSTLYWAFHFLPGQLLKFEVNKNDQKHIESWEIKTDYYNNTFIEDDKTGAIAYFVNDGKLFYFTQFKGSWDTLLYRFFLGSFKVLLGVEKELEVKDRIPLHLYNKSLLRYLHDAIAPLKPMMHAEFRLSYEEIKASIGEENVILRSRTWLTRPWKSDHEVHYELELKNYKLHIFKFWEEKTEITARCIN